MDILTIFVVIILAAMIHASFHLSISVLTLLSGHTLSKEKSHFKLVKLAFALVLGAITATVMIFCSFAYFAEIFYNITFSKLTWCILIGLLMATAVSVWAFYYRRNSRQVAGTELWIPRSMAKYLSNRASKTKHSAEAFTLGVGSVLSEIMFFAAPLTVATLLSSVLPPAYQFVAVVIYTTIANLPIFSIACIISGGHQIAQIQIWRENNKRFLQFVAGLGLFILAFLVAVMTFNPEILRF